MMVMMMMIAMTKSMIMTVIIMMIMISIYIHTSLLSSSQVLITTNVLARGVDIPAVGVVVNYDIPVERQGQKVVADEATYLHRIGR